MPAIARVADFKTDSEDVKTFYNVIAAFLTVDTGKEVKAEDIDGIIKPAEMKKIAITLLEAYGFPCRILTVTVKILKTKRKKTQTRRPGINVARLLYVGCKVLNYSEKEVLEMTLRKFYLIYNEYLDYNGLRKKDEELNLDTIF